MKNIAEKWEEKNIQRKITKIRKKYYWLVFIVLFTEYERTTDSLSRLIDVAGTQLEYFSQFESVWVLDLTNTFQIGSLEVMQDIFFLTLHLWLENLCRCSFITHDGDGIKGKFGFKLHARNTTQLDSQCHADIGIFSHVIDD